MEETNWLRITIDFIVGLNAITQKKSGDSRLDALSFLHQQSGACKLFFVEKLDRLTAQVLYAIPATDDLEILEPDFLETLNPTIVSYFKEGYPKEIEKIITKQHNVAILPLVTGSTSSCIILEFRPEFVFCEGFKEFIDVSLTRIKEISQLTDTYNYLESLEARFNGILQTVPQSIVFIDSSGKNSWLNEPASELFKLKPGNIEPALLSAAMQLLRNQADNKTEIFEFGMKLFKSENKRVTDWKWIFSAPEPLILNVYCTPVNSENASGMLWMFDDVTMQYLYEKQLKELNEKLVEISSYKSQFLANMSHELRTPLNSILILADLLAENLNQNLTPKQVEYAQIINRSGTDLLTIINDILDLSKIEAGKMDLVYNYETIAGIVKNMSDLFTVVSKENDITFTISVESDVPESIFTDKLRLEQIIKNLLSNAFKFTPEHGKVSLTICRHSEKEEFLTIAVSDTGIGVEEEKLQHIFEAFKQANGSTTRQFGGTGLGLSISKELIWKFGGEIHLESIFGKGSTFSISLPIVECQPSANGETISEPTDTAVKDQSVYQLLKGKHVLIADNDMRNLFAVDAVLSGYEMTVLTAIDTTDTLEQLRENASIDLIIVEQMLPTTDDFDPITTIRENTKNSDLPIIALINSESNDTVNMVIQSGASDCLLKPIINEQLMEKVLLWIQAK